MFCRSLFIFYPLYCLSIFDSRLLINHLVYWIVHTHVTRNGSFLRYSKPRHIGKGELVIDLIVILMYDIFPTKFFFIGQVMLRKDKFYLKSACNNRYNTSSCKPLIDRFSNIFDVLHTFCLL